MTRDELDQLMLLYAAGATDAPEKALVEARLVSGDLAAQASYAEAMAVVHSLPQALELQSPPKRVRDDLMHRVLASTQTQTPVSPTSKSVSYNRVGWTTWATGGIAAALAIGMVWMWSENQHVRSELAIRTQQELETNRIAASPHVQLTKLHIGDNQTDAEGQANGRIIYCPVTNQYQLRVFRMSAPAAGREYELWLITPEGKPMPAGTFVVDQRGSATIYFHAPKGMDFQLAAVTDEPLGGSPTPTGQMHLKGSLSIQ